MGAPIEYVKQRYTGLVDAGDFRPFDDPFDPSTEDYWNTMLDGTDIFLNISMNSY